MTEEKYCLSDTKQHLSRKEQLLLVIAHQRQSRSLTAARQPQTMLDPHHIHMPAPLDPGLFPSGARVPVVGGNWSSLDPTQVFCSSNLRLDPTSNRAVTATDLRGSPTSHPTLALTLLFPVSPLTRMIAASRPWGKTWLVFIPNPTLPPKPLDTHRLYRKAYH